MTNPFFIDTDENPNEPFGVRACTFVGQQKHPDCAGQWRTWHNIKIANPLAPFMTACAFHRNASLPSAPKQRSRRSPSKTEIPSL